MLKGRRVGTLSTGLVLILFGVLFLLHLFFPRISYLFIFQAWPAILILLGLELIVSFFTNREEKLRYDTGAVFLMIVLALFSMGMGFMEFLFEYGTLTGGQLRFF